MAATTCDILSCSWGKSAKRIAIFLICVTLLTRSLNLRVMSCLYSLWDIIEDLVARKVNESDASQFSHLCCGGCIPAQLWGVLWFLVSVCFLALAVIAALLVFKEENTGSGNTNGTPSNP